MLMKVVQKQKSKNGAQTNGTTQPARDDFLSAIVKQFINRRKELGLTQEDVDSRMGTADRLCSKWECGQRLPTSFNFFCWAQALDAKLTLIPELDQSEC